MAFQHGITATESTTGARSLTQVSTAVIGLVATAPTADQTAFPLDTPVLVTDLAAAIGNAGDTGTLKGALQAIADQTAAPVVVVRVTAGADAAATSANVVGTTNGSGVKTGMQALVTAEASVGVRPRILGCPGLDTQTVTAALVVVAQKLRGMAYASAIGATVAAAIAYRANFSARELMLIMPDFLSAPNVTSFAVARALGLRARIDQEQGWHRTLSNVPVQGVVGVTKSIGFDVQDAGCEANLLNAKEVTTIVAANGLRFWGSRTTAEAGSTFAFESAARTAQVLLDTIAGGMMWAIDKPLRPSLVKDIVETINGEIRAMVAAGRLLGGRAWFDPAKNGAAQLAAGKLAINYEYQPVPPLENLLLTQTITDSYTADFAASVAA